MQDVHFGCWLAAFAFAFGFGCTEPERRPPPPGSGAPGGGAAGVGDEPDDPRDPIDSTCDPWGDPVTQCGPGGVCSFVDMRCHAEVGMGDVGAPCDLFDSELWLGSCAPGLVCVVGAGSGRCALACRDEQGCVEPHERCRLPAGQTPTPVCVATCDPFLQDCRPDEGCYLLQSDDPGPVCALAGDGLELEPCVVSTDCAFGHHCTPPQTHMVECASTVGCCTPYCDVEIGDCVAINPICAPLGAPDAPNLGVCIGEL